MNCLLALRIIENKIRFGIRQLVCGGKIEVKGMTLISKRCKVEVGRGASLIFKQKDRAEEGCLIAARKGALVEFGENVFINRNCMIVAHKMIHIGSGTQIGPYVCIYDHDHDILTRGATISLPVNIGENVWIGAGSLIFKGVTIGNNAIISGGAVVTKNVPENCILIQKRQTVITPINKEIKENAVKEESVDSFI